MPTRYKGTKKRAAKKRASKKGSKGGSKAGGGAAGGGGGGTDGLTPTQDPIIIAGGGSVELQFNRGQFIAFGARLRNGVATLSHIIVDGKRTTLGPKSVIEIHFL